jgi:hypothetical protein
MLTKRGRDLMRLCASFIKGSIFEDALLGKTDKATMDFLREHEKYLKRKEKTLLEKKNNL